MIYITGDTHGDFSQMDYFANKLNTSTGDILIILGDAGINYSKDFRDEAVKEHLKTIPLTFFCIHGNHEARPETIGSYEEVEWHGGVAYVEEAYPNIIFAKDGEIYDFEGKKAIVIGGAYSVDKFYRLSIGAAWFEDEQLTQVQKRAVEKKLDSVKWNVDYVLTHTCPFKYIPTEMFLPGIDQSTVDNTTEQWLDKIEDKLKYKKWCCGHWHTDKVVDKMWFFFNDIDALIPETEKEKKKRKK